MKSKFIRPLSLVLALLLAISVFSACGGSNNTDNTAEGTTKSVESTTQETTPAATPLPQVELIWYVLGDAHADQAKVDTEVNKKLQQDLNCTLKLTFTTWNEWQSKYNLLLVSGEPIDMIFASAWADFSKFAKMGAFKDITDLLPEYAPQTWANVPKDDWASATVDGKIVAVPSTSSEFTPAGLFYREDLRKKYSLPEIKDVASIEAYLEGIKNNDKDMKYPWVTNASDDILNLYFWANKIEPIAGAQDDVIQVKSYDTPRDLILYPFTDEFANFCKMTKAWKDKGYWSSEVLSSKIAPGDALKTGKTAVANMIPATAAGYFNNFKQEHPGWEGGYLPYTSFKGYALPNYPMNNGMAIPKSAKNPERSLMVLDLLRNDTDYFRLSTYGIPGYHWEHTEDNRILVPAKGQDPKVNPGFWTTSWGWFNYKLALDSVNMWSGWKGLMEEMRGIQKPNYLIDIKIDKEPVKTEAAAIANVQEKYKSILTMGLVSDVDKTLAEYRDQLKKAGVDRYFEEVKKQLFQYYDEKGIK